MKEATIDMNGQKLKKLIVYFKFLYLGNTLSSAVHIEDEGTGRRRLRQNDRERNEIKLDAKLKVHRAVVQSTAYMLVSET